MLHNCRQQGNYKLTKGVQTGTILELVQLELNGLPTN